MDFLLELRHVCERHPILFYFKILCAILCVIPSLLLLFAVLRSSLHSNCRIMLCMWVMSQLLVYATVCWLSVQYIFFETEWFSENFSTQGMRKYILSWYVPCWIMCTCFELGINLERGYSIRNPSQYHKSETAYFSILTYCILSLALSYVTSECILSGAQTISATVGALLSNSLDIAAFSTNFMVLYLAKRKERRSEKDLNERYQIRETYSIARAMVPVYCMGTSLKVGIIIINWMYVTHAVPFSVSEVVYLSFSELSCGLTSTMFLVYHVRLRSKITCFRRQSTSQITSMSVETNTIANTESYFGQLSEAWK